MTRKFVKFSKHFSLCWRERKVAFSTLFNIGKFYLHFWLCWSRDCSMGVACDALRLAALEFCRLFWLHSYNQTLSIYLYMHNIYLRSTVNVRKKMLKKISDFFLLRSFRCLFTWLCWARLTGEWIRETSFDLIWISTTRMSKRSRNIHNTQHQCQLQIQKSINLIVPEEIFRLLELRRRQKPKRREIKTFLCAQIDIVLLLLRYDLFKSKSSSSLTKSPLRLLKKKTSADTNAPCRCVFFFCFTKRRINIVVFGGISNGGFLIFISRRDHSTQRVRQWNDDEREKKTENDKVIHNT